MISLKNPCNVQSSDSIRRRKYKCRSVCRESVICVEPSSDQLSSSTMKSTSIFLSLLLASVLAQEKINLEDIERDTLANERQVKGSNSDAPSNNQHVAVLQNYKFVPIKTQADYIQKHPTGQNLFSHHRFVLNRQQHPTQQSKEFISPPPQRQVIQQKHQARQKYVLPNQYFGGNINLQYNNVNSGVDYLQQPNDVKPQYVTVSKNNHQGATDPNSKFQYIMYVPVYVPSASTSQNVVLISPPLPKYSSHGYQQVVPIFQQPEAAYQQSRYEVTARPHVNSIAIVSTSAAHSTSKIQPKSLLDSYIPSYLQLHYLKQQQKQAAQVGLINTPHTAPPQEAETMTNKPVHVEAIESTNSPVYQQFPLYIRT